jgi:hypothetical protein
MTERNDINYGTVGGYTNEYSPSEIGLGQDWDAKALMLAEQERAKAQRGQWQRKTHYNASGLSIETHSDGSITVHYGQFYLNVAPNEVATLAQACAKALSNQNGKSDPLRHKSTIF